MLHRSRVIRWHTHRVVLLTSLVWVILGLCVLVYYMNDCLGFNTINCNANVRDYDLDISVKPVVGDETMVVLRENKHQKEYIDKRGIHVIVGQYMGRGQPWESSPNLTDEILNMNEYSPVYKSGENGLPVYVPEFESNKMKTLFHINRFNLLASDRISVNRSLPDPRKQSCKEKQYKIEILGDTSVIIVFHNEAWSTLVRTVHSVIYRSPHQLLNEIILVDDFSQRTFLGQQLDNYMEELSQNVSVPIIILRSTNRIGLIKARLLGANIANGKVLTFLDAHCETTNGWLEPLLYYISKDRKQVVCPIIDIIHDETFAYTRSFELHWGAFNWELHFRWYPIGQTVLNKNRKKRFGDTIPFRTPVMAGGLFAINRDYFYEIGSYDSHMNIWGGENIEMSLRVWQCGGSIVIVPCSHVAHLFRRSSPYSFGGKDVADVLYTNLARVAEVWLDEWKNFFYKLNPIASKVLDKNRDMKLVNISHRIELRQKLKCKSFEWYLENVWPEHFFPSRDRFYGKIQNMQSMECLERPSSKTGHNVGTVELSKCAIEIFAPQNFVYTKHGYLMTDESVCVDVNDAVEDTSLLLLACNEFNRQKWKYDPKSKSIIHMQTKLCLDLITSNKKLTLKRCSNQSNSQKWEMFSVEWQ